MEKDIEEREKVWKGIIFRCFSFNLTACGICVGCKRFWIKGLLEQYITTGQVRLDIGVSTGINSDWMLRFFQYSVTKTKRLFTNFQAIEILDAYGLNE